MFVGKPDQEGLIMTVGCVHVRVHACVCTGSNPALTYDSQVLYHCAMLLALKRLILFLSLLCLKGRKLGFYVCIVSEV